MTFKPTTEMIRAAEAVFAAKALVLARNPIVNGYKSKILAEGLWLPREEYIEGPKGEPKPILVPSRSWMMGDDDFKEYQRRCNLARIEAGLCVDDPEKCPLLVAESLERDATRNLFDVFQPINKFSYNDVMSSRNCMENLKRSTSLMLQLMAPFVRKAEEILQPA
jgi:hypothetical protein